jgi:hypothetical protein
MSSLIRFGYAMYLGFILGVFGIHITGEPIKFCFIFIPTIILVELYIWYEKKHGDNNE